jgi:hypothetical protein
VDIHTTIQLSIASTHNLCSSSLITHDLLQYWRPSLKEVPAKRVSNVQSLAMCWHLFFDKLITNHVEKRDGRSFPTLEEANSKGIGRGHLRVSLERHYYQGKSL